MQAQPSRGPRNPDCHQEYLSDIPHDPALEFLLGLEAAAWTLDALVVDWALFGNAGVEFGEGDVWGPLEGLVVHSVDIELIREVHS